MKNVRLLVQQAEAAAREWGHEITEAAPQGDVDTGLCEPYFALLLGGKEWIVEGRYNHLELRVRDFDGYVALTIPTDRPKAAALQLFMCWMGVADWIAPAQDNDTDEDSGFVPFLAPLAPLGEPA